MDQVQPPPIRCDAAPASEVYYVYRHHSVTLSALDGRDLGYGRSGYQLTEILYHPQYLAGLPY